jgi:hypothetical protein
MSSETIIYERIEGLRTYKIVNGDTTYALVDELFTVQVFEDNLHIFDATGFLSVEKAKAWIKEKVNDMRRYRVRHKVWITEIETQQLCKSDAIDIRGGWNEKEIDANARDDQISAPGFLARLQAEKKDERCPGNNQRSDCSKLQPIDLAQLA